MRGSKAKLIRRLSKVLAAQRNIPWVNTITEKGRTVLVHALVGPPKPFTTTGTTRLVKCGKSIYKTIKKRYKRRELYV